MSNHRAWTLDHRGSKSLGLKLLPLDHHLDGYVINFKRYQSRLNRIKKEQEENSITQVIVVTN